MACSSPAKLPQPTCWVPLHQARELWRGYNQAARIAQQLSEQVGIVNKNLLNRKINNIPQVQFDRKQRLVNVKDVFEVVKNAENHIREKNILLIDDVCTTGATLNECAKKLKRAGAKRVDGLVLVRGTGR